MCHVRHLWRNIPHEAILKMHTISASYLFSILSTCVENGAPETELLPLIPGAGHSLNIADIQNNDTRYSVDIVLQILAKTEKITGIANIGLLCGRNIRPAAMNELGNAVMCSKTLRQAILLNRKYQALTQELGQTNLQVRQDLAGQDLAWLLWKPNYSNPEYGRLVTDMVISGHAIFGRWLSWVHDKKIEAVHLRHAKPIYAELYNDIFDCPVLFGQAENAMLIDNNAIDMPLPQANAQSLTEICHRLDIALTKLHPHKPLRQQVTDILYVEVPNGPINLEQIARRLGLSPRGLRRNLTAEHTSFRKVLETTRRTLCEEYLRDNTPLLTIADKLGYSQQSAFNRAFKDWYGTTPKDYMKAQQTANTAFEQLAP